MKKLTSILLVAVILTLAFSFNACKEKEPEGLTFDRLLLSSSDNDYVWSVRAADCELTNVVIPATYKGRPVVGVRSFAQCKTLKSITIPDSVTSIGAWAFSECYSLTSITIPASVTSIGENAFNSCTSLTSINFEGTVEQWNSISFGDYWNDDIPATEVVCSDGTVTL